MNYDPDKIKTEYVVIDGKKIPLQKIPTGMIGPNATRLAESSYTNDETESKDQFKINDEDNKIYDEENVTINTDTYLDI